MIDFLSSWAKGLGLAIVVVSILEMLLPNNKTKKYIRAVMGVYILFTMISPFIKNKNIFDVNNIDLQKYISTETSSSINQNTMNDKIQQLYIEEIQKDITKKIEEKGFKVVSCKVNAQIGDDESKTEISKIRLNLKKDDNKKNLNNINNTNTNNTNSLSKSDIQNIKKFLIEEYEVSEQCLEIN